MGSVIEGEEEAAAAPPHVPTDTTMATTTTGKAAAAATAHTSFFSPQKRKRDASPLDPETMPWRLQHSVPHGDDDGDGDSDGDGDGDGDVGDERLRVESDEAVASGQVSPRSNKLASQLSDLSLSGKLAGSPPLREEDLEITMTLEEELPAAKKVKRRGRPANGKTKTTVTVNGSDEDLATAPAAAKRKGRGTLGFGEENANGGGKEAVNGNTRRRLRSPPLPRSMDSGASDECAAAVVEESDGGVDSDDPEQLGIGYKPTLMQRHARDRKRMQQVTYVPHRFPFNCWGFFLLRAYVVQIKEYKARVSKEAREKRSETRRKRRSFPGRPAARGTDSAEEGERRKVVHFNLEPVVVEPAVVNPVPEDAVAPEISTMPD